MSTDQTTETYDIYQLSKTTPWREQQWRKAKEWMGWDDAKFAEMVPVIIAMGGEPYAMASILRSLERQDKAVLSGVDGLRARRYVEARAVAAAFEERLKFLTELLEEEHWRADQAESALGALQYGDQMPRVWMPGVDEEPPEDISALIDLNGGRVYARYANTDDWYRPDAGRRSVMVYRWPIADSGPFIALPEAWDLHRITQEQERRADEEQQIKSLLYAERGYKTFGSLPDSIASVLQERTTRFVEEKLRADQAESQVRRLEQQLSELALAWSEGAEATAEWMANNPGPSGIPIDPPSNPYESPAGSES